MLIYKILKKEYKCNSKQPLNYYEFVIDPQSFSKTIENIFHFSFLIKDCLAEIHIGIIITHFEYIIYFLFLMIVRLECVTPISQD